MLRVLPHRPKLFAGMGRFAMFPICVCEFRFRQQAVSLHEYDPADQVLTAFRQNRHGYPPRDSQVWLTVIWVTRQLALF